MKDITPNDHDIIVPLLYLAQRQNCNYSFANLCSWQRFFSSQYEIVDDTLIVRFNLHGHHAYLLAAPKDHPIDICIKWMKQDASSNGEPLRLIAIEEDLALQLRTTYGEQVVLETIRDRYDYIYHRCDLALLAGKDYHGKRNHANKFRSLYPNYEYHSLSPEFFEDCLELTDQWGKDHPDAAEGAVDEKASIAFVFEHWNQLNTIGGVLLVDGRVVAFSYGCPITPTLFDTCVEKADTNYEGSYTVINQEMASHLPEHYTHINREEDLGLAGLRKAKLSYHPSTLLTLYSATFQPQYQLIPCIKERDKDEVIDWMVRQYGFKATIVDSWIEQLHWNWPLSVKAVDNDGKTLGFLNMSDYRIDEETEHIQRDAPALLKELNAQHYTAVFSFIVAPECRGTRLNYDMIMYIMPQLRQYDFIFIPVMHHLHTHTYWQRWGAREFYRDSECVYYKWVP